MSLSPLGSLQVSAKQDSSQPSSWRDWACTGNWTIQGHGKFLRHFLCHWKICPVRPGGDVVIFLSLSHGTSAGGPKGRQIISSDGWERPLQHRGLSPVGGDGAEQAAGSQPSLAIAASKQLACSSCLRGFSPVSLQACCCPSRGGGARGCTPALELGVPAGQPELSLWSWVSAKNRARVMALCWL